MTMPLPGTEVGSRPGRPVGRDPRVRDGVPRRHDRQRRAAAHRRRPRRHVAGLQWTVNGYLLTLAAFVLLGGALGDRLGRRKIFLIGIVWFTVASVLCAIAPTIEYPDRRPVPAGRRRSALLTPGSLAMIQARFRRRGPRQGDRPVVGPRRRVHRARPVRRRLADRRALLALGVPDQRAAGAHRGPRVTPEWVPESRDAQGMATRFDVTRRRAVPRSRSAGITYALIEAPDDGYGSMPVIGAVAVGVGCAAVPSCWSSAETGDAAMMPPPLFRSRVFTVLNIYTWPVYAALSGQSFFLAVQLQNVAGYARSQTGLATCRSRR